MNDSSKTFTEKDGGGLVEIAVRPRAGRCRVVGVRGGRVRIEVTAAPEGGEATSQALATLAAAVGLRVSAVSLVRGAHHRHKTVFLAGISIQDFMRKIGEEIDGPIG